MNILRGNCLSEEKIVVCIKTLMHPFCRRNCEAWPQIHHNSSNISINIDTVKKIPIPPDTINQQREIVLLVDKIHEEKRKDFSADTSAIEFEIDLLVYHLYGLNYDEVLIVDPETPITREKYDSIN